MKTLAKRIGVKFAKVIPSGNPTVLLFENEIAKKQLPSMALEIMPLNHLYAEQVGYLHFHQTDTPHLQMMGGEFCMNATRSAVALIAHLGKRIEFDSTSHYGIVEITVSGYPSVITSVLSSDEKSLLQKLSTSKDILPQYKKSTKEKSFSQLQPYVGESQLYVASCIECSSSSIEKLDQGVFLAKLPGITHLLLDESIHSLPHNWQEESEQWRSRYALDNDIACGIIWFNHSADNCSIYPAIFVSKIQSEQMETSCGSGSLAAALMLRKFEEKKDIIKITQPSGEKLSVLFSSDSTVWIAGNVIIAATGKTYISTER